MRAMTDNDNQPAPGKCKHYGGEVGTQPFSLRCDGTGFCCLRAVLESFKIFLALQVMTTHFKDEVQKGEHSPKEKKEEGR